MLNITVLVDNNAGSCSAGELKSEWGLAVYIEYDGKKILLDTGASGLFAENADKLGVRLEEVDLAVLSHAHWDHSDGMDVFFARNSTAPFYLSENARENCWAIHRDVKENGEEGIEYDGIKKGWLETYADRIIYSGTCEICKGVHLVGHSTPGLEKRGEQVGQYIMVDGELIPDDFAHEQSLIFETGKGLVIFNSCSHGGVDNIIREAEEALPGRKAYAMIGGFHLFLDSEEEVRAFAGRICDVGIKRIVTGHCTGDKQYVWLKDELEKRDKEIVVEHLRSGLKMTLA